MFRRTFVFLLLFVPIVNFGQNSIESINDTIFNYEQGKKYYLLDFIGTHHVIYFDSVVYDNSQPITILIRNNTEDTIFISLKTLMSANHIFLENSTRCILPSECYSVSLTFYPSKYRIENMAILNDSFTFSYTNNDSIQYFGFAMKGYVQLGMLPKIEAEEHPDVIIATTPLTKPKQQYQSIQPLNEGTANMRLVEESQAAIISEFKFRKELWIYPFTSDSILPTNITLKYFINDSSHYAKKRRDSLNHVYFKIPMELGDTVYCVLSSPEYGFIAKKTIVRERVNELTISFEHGPKLDQPHYYDWTGSRVEISKHWIGCYFIPRGIVDSKLMIQDFRKHIDSMNSRIKEYDAVLNYGLDGYILKCKPEFAIQVKRKLGNYVLYQLIDENRWLTDTYGIFLSSKLTKEKITEILFKYGITDFHPSPTPYYGNNLENNLISHVYVTLKNLPSNNSNSQTINDMLGQQEILKVTQTMIDFPKLDNY